MGKQIYDLGNVTSWKYAVVMSAAGTNSAWNMTLNQTGYPGRDTNMKVYTVGNGLDIIYDIIYNPITYQVDRMHAKGSIGDYYQERNTSTQQVLTLPDTGLLFPYTALNYAGDANIKDKSGKVVRLEMFTASNNHGNSLTYWVNPSVPVPIIIELVDPDYNLSMMLLEYKGTEGTVDPVP